MYLRQTAGGEEEQRDHQQGGQLYSLDVPETDSWWRGGAERPPAGRSAPFSRCINQGAFFKIFSPSSLALKERMMCSKLKMPLISCCLLYSFAT
jgi:hypothetical protein